MSERYSEWQNDDFSHDREFVGVPAATYSQEIDVELLRLAGLRTEKRRDVGLVALQLAGYKYSGTDEWQVHALVFETYPDSEKTYVPNVLRRLGIISIDTEVDGGEVLSVAEEWIRDSEATEWVPGHVVQLYPILDNGYGTLYQSGALLVRAKPL